MKLFVLDRNKWNHLTVKKKSSVMFKDVIYKMFWDVGWLFGFYGISTVTIPPRPPEDVNFFKPFHFLAGDHLVVPIGVSQIS